MPGTAGHPALEQPSDWVARFAPLIPAGPVLDLACGSGRHARLLASTDNPVLAVDRNAGALAQLAAQGERNITTLEIDLEQPNAERAQPGWPLQSARYSGIVVTNYLHRPLFPALFASLAEGGVLIYETFAAGNERYGKPSSPAFLLQPGELLQRLAEAPRVAGAVPAWRVIAFEDGYTARPRPAMVQRICVLRGQPSSDAALSL
jgi:SAM-dependent methyltransferase